MRSRPVSGFWALVILGAPWLGDESAPASACVPPPLRTLVIGFSAHLATRGGFTWLSLHLITPAKTFCKHGHVPRLQVDTSLWAVFSPLCRANRCRARPSQGQSLGDGQVWAWLEPHGQEEGSVGLSERWTPSWGQAPDRRPATGLPGSLAPFLSTPVSCLQPVGLGCRRIGEALRVWRGSGHSVNSDWPLGVPESTPERPQLRTEEAHPSVAPALSRGKGAGATSSPGVLAPRHPHSSAHVLFTLPPQLAHSRPSGLFTK